MSVDNQVTNKSSIKIEMKHCRGEPYHVLCPRTKRKYSAHALSRDIHGGGNEMRTGHDFKIYGLKLQYKR